MLHENLRQQLADRRRRLEAVAGEGDCNAQVEHLLEEVDEALRRLEAGAYGLCKTCRALIEGDRLCADPLLAYCLDHLRSEMRTALEKDRELAAQIQSGLLPRQELHLQGWRIAHHFEGSGPASGDDCDLIEGSDGSVCFLVGDISGKGLSASILRTHLRAPPSGRSSHSI